MFSVFIRNINTYKFYIPRYYFQYELGVAKLRHYLSSRLTYFFNNIANISVANYLVVLLFKVISRAFLTHLSRLFGKSLSSSNRVFRVNRYSNFRMKRRHFYWIDKKPAGGSGLVVFKANSVYRSSTHFFMSFRGPSAFFKYFKFFLTPGEFREFRHSFNKSNYRERFTQHKYHKRGFVDKYNNRNKHIQSTKNFKMATLSDYTYLIKH